jgi:hypothetical protein
VIAANDQRIGLAAQPAEVMQVDRAGIHVKNVASLPIEARPGDQWS